MSEPYRLELKSSLQQDLKNIERKYVSKIIKAIEDLANNPFSTKSKRLSGSQSSYRLRVGDYRIIYQIDKEERLITVYYVRHRRDVYKKTKL